MRRALVPALLSLASFVAAVVEAAPVRLVRATAGSKGAIHGSRYIVEDPRTTFGAGIDRQVIAHFEWEGAPGTHECVVTWKDPTGATVLVSPYTQRATTARFSVYWTLTLPDAPRIGLWAAEARVDGQPAGTLTFQIQQGPPPAGGATAARRVLAPEEMYARANTATLTVEALDAAGRTIHRVSGFVAGEGRAMTAFQAVEGATRLRVGPPGGAATVSDRLLGWNRKQDWAVIAAPGVAGLALSIDRARSWKVGDRCSFLEVGADGSRAITETTIVGAQDFPGRGPRILLASAFGYLSTGAPLLDEHGDAIAVLGGTLMPGAGLPSQGVYLSYGTGRGSQTMAVPTSVMASTELGGPGETLAALAARGVFARPLVGPRNVLTGTIARKVETQNNVPLAMDEMSEFRSGEPQAVAFLTFDPQEKRDGMAAFKIYDEDNRVVMEGKPSKFSLRPRRYQVTTWPFPIAKLKPGQYRIDFVIDADPVWRSSFRVVD